MFTERELELLKSALKRQLEWETNKRISGNNINEDAHTEKTELFMKINDILYS